MTMAPVAACCWLRGERFALGELRDGGQESSNVSHADGLEDDADANAEGTLAADDIDQEESTEDGRNELDHSEDCCGKKFLILTLGAEKCKEIRPVNCNTLRARPL